MPRLLSAKVVLYLLLLLILDVCIMPVFRWTVFYPVFLYLMVLYAAFEWHGRQVVALGVVCGLLRDLVSFQPLGVETVVLSFSSILLSLLVQKIDRQSFLMRAAVSFLFVVMVSFSVLILSRFLVSSGEISWYPFLVCLLMAFSSAAIMPIFFYFTGRLFHDRTPLKQYELFS